MTAQDFIEKYNYKHNSEYSVFDINTKFMVEFAKYHVEQALKSADELANIQVVTDFGTDRTTSKELTFTERGGHGLPDVISTISIASDSILNAYPLENIK